jgi:hypothetical protein
VASALTEYLEVEGLTNSRPKIFLDYQALCRYLKSDDAVSEYLDLTYGLQEGSVEAEIAMLLNWCVAQLRTYWMAPAVARCLQWLSHNQNILGTLSESEFCFGADSPERISFVFCLVAAVIERTEY